jgi:probable HAF family extracellular repeat protein
MLTRGLGTLLAALLTAGPVAGSAARHYTLTDLGTLGGPGATAAYAMNDAGVVVGVSDTGAAPHAFRWRDGVMTDLGVLPGGTRSAAYGINESGVIAGTAYRPTGEPRAVIWRAGLIRDLGLPDSHALAINDSGQVLALTTGPDRVTRRVLWRAGHVTPAGPENDYQATEGDLNNEAYVTMRLRDRPGGPWVAGSQRYGWTRGYGPVGAAADINNQGVMVGAAPDGHGRIRPYRHEGGAVDLGTLGGRNGAATAINDDGVIAGYADTAAGVSRPVLWADGRILDLTRRGVTGVDVIVDLNRPGQMIASAGGRAVFIG